MANERVRADDVQAIIDTDLTNLFPFISAAHLIVDQKLSDKNLGEPLLKEIERWMAAHLVAIRDPKIKSESIGAASTHYESSVMGKGLEGTSFGQQVLLLDTSGTLSQLGKKRVVIKVDDFRDT